MLRSTHELTDAAGVGREVIHRDVSPQNVMVTYAGEVKVLDFGIAKASGSARTQTGHLKGKCEYMSPEQCRGEPLDRRSDIFSLGILLYELTVGKRLFKRDNAVLALHAVCHAPIPRPTEVDPQYPRILEPICARALARDRRDRYATMLEMRRDLVAAIMLRAAYIPLAGAVLAGCSVPPFDPCPCPTDYTCQVELNRCIRLSAKPTDVDGCAIYVDHKFYCSNTGGHPGSPLYMAPAVSSDTIVNHVQTAYSWFTCWAMGESHTRGNHWYCTEGDDTGNQTYGWISGDAVFAPQAFDSDPSAFGFLPCPLDAINPSTPGCGP